MAPTSLPKIADDLVWRLLDDNAVVVTPKDGEVRVFNRVGTVIWQQLLDGKNIDDIENYLTLNFQVSSQEARKDIILFLNDLTERGIIMWETSSTQ